MDRRYSGLPDLGVDVVSNFSSSSSPEKGQWDDCLNDAVTKINKMSLGSFGEEMTDSSAFSSPQKLPSKPAQRPPLINIPSNRDNYGSFSPRWMHSAYSDTRSSDTPDSPYSGKRGFRGNGRSYSGRYTAPRYSEPQPWTGPVVNGSKHGNDHVTAAAWWLVTQSKHTQQIMHNNTRRTNVHSGVTGLQPRSLSGDSGYCGSDQYSTPPDSSPHIARKPTNGANDPYYTAVQARMQRFEGDLSDVDALVWNGNLPKREHSDATIFSCKVFVGGVPWDITEDCLLTAFTKYGPCVVEWPGSERSCSSKSKSSGYVYMVFNIERSVHELMKCCSTQFGGNKFFLPLRCKRLRSREIRQVQIIPWVPEDSKWSLDGHDKFDPKLTVFIGALHGMVTAKGLARVFNDKFGCVTFAGIDTDRHKYPIGSAHVTFENEKSYLMAVKTAFVQMSTDTFTKKVQIDPYLQDSACDVCKNTYGPYYCRDMDTCFKYFCRGCWKDHHDKIGRQHQPLLRSSRRGSYHKSEKLMLSLHDPAAQATATLPQQCPPTLTPFQFRI